MPFAARRKIERYNSIRRAGLSSENKGKGEPPPVRKLTRHQRTQLLGYSPYPHIRATGQGMALAWLRKRGNDLDRGETAAGCFRCCTARLRGRTS